MHPLRDRLGRLNDADAALEHLAGEPSLSADQRGLLLNRKEQIAHARYAADGAPDDTVAPLRKRASMRHQAMDRRVLLGLQGPAAPVAVAASTSQHPLPCIPDLFDEPRDHAVCKGRDRSQASISIIGQSVSGSL